MTTMVTPSLYNAHVAGADVASSLLGGRWRLPDLVEAATTFAASHCWPRAGLVELLAAAQQARAAPGAARAATNTLAGNALAVVAGQQPALGGGPLLSLVKAGQALALAAALRAHGIAAEAVFWVAGEDHDAGEAGHADLIDDRGQIERVRAPLPQPGAALRHQAAAAGWEVLTRALQARFGASLGTAFWTDLRPQSDEDLSAWCARLLENVFAAHGLIVIEAHHLRPLWTATLARALTAWPSEALARVPAPAHPLGKLAEPPLFADDPRVRQSLTPAQAIALLDQDPLRISPGAGLRPLLQQAVLPCLAYVAGPGELAYHAQLGPLYPALGLPRPRLVPRRSCSLVSSALARGLRAWGLDPEQLDPAAAPTIADPEPASDLAQLDAALATLTRAEGKVEADADRQRRLATGLRRLQRERDRLAASLARGRRRAAERPAPSALHAALFPRGRAQDRCLSLAQAIWRHGPGLANLLIGDPQQADDPSPRWLRV